MGMQSCVVVAYVGLLWQSLLPFSFATHFYMGSISWKIPPGSSNTVTFQWTTAWVRTQGPCGFGCSPTNIGKPARSASGIFRCGALGLSCTMFELIVGWVVGVNMRDDWEQETDSFTYTFPTSGTYHVEFDDSSWGPLGYINPNASLFLGYRVSTIVRFGARSDTGLPNTGPRTTSFPVYRYQCGCSGSTIRTIQIPISDADGDVVRCRWSTMPEASDSAESFPHAQVSNPSPGICQVTFDMSGAHFANMCNNTYYAVALSVEDFPTASVTMGGHTYSPSDALSLSGLQFVVFLVPLTSASCLTAPTWQYSTPAAYTNLQTRPGNSVNISFYAQDNSGTNISAIDVVTPGGNLTLLAPDDQGRASVWMVTWEWNPSVIEQDQIYGVCAIAHDALGKPSEQRCFFVMVHGTRNISAASISGTFPVVTGSGTTGISKASTRNTVAIAAGAAGAAALLLIGGVVLGCCCYKGGIGRRRKTEDDKKNKHKHNSISEKTRKTMNTRLVPPISSKMPPISSKMPQISV